jgi:cysteine-rich repeat protein
MRFRSSSAASVLAVLSLGAVLMVGCGGGGGGRDLDDCGNGRIDDGEACDDGNVADDDGCLSTCELATCGDGYFQKDPAGVEECDLVVNNTDPKSCNPDLTVRCATCATLGFRSGTHTCTNGCGIDPRYCSGSAGPTPIASATPAGATPTAAAGTPTAGGPTETGGAPTPTLDAATPTPRPTAVGSVCGEGATIAVVIALDAEVTSARLDLAYPAAANLPGSGPDPSVKDRVAFTGSGLTVVNDVDGDEDLVDDTVTASLVGTDVVPAGPFATVTFDCVAGQPLPTAASFTCTVVSASNAGTAVPAACSIGLP